MNIGCMSKWKDLNNQFGMIDMRFQKDILDKEMSINHTLRLMSKNNSRS